MILEQVDLQIPLPPDRHGNPRSSQCCANAVTTFTDPLATLRLFADMRNARLTLRGLDSPSPAQRARMIRDPVIYKALCDLLFAAEKLVAGPDQNALFWHIALEACGEVEKRIETTAPGVGGMTSVSMMPMSRRRNAGEAP